MVEIKELGPLVNYRGNLLKGALFYFTQCSKGITISRNNFTSCSGIRGIIQVEDDGYSHGLVIYSNNFTHVSGLFRSNVLNLVSSYNSTQKACTGFHIQANLFLQNASPPGERAIIYLSCQNDNILQIDDLDCYNGEEIMTQLDQQLKEFSPYQPLIRIHEDNIIVDQARLTIKQNSFIENFRGNSEGQLLEILYFPYVTIQNNTFLRNGDISISRLFVDSPLQFWRRYSGIHLRTLNQTYDWQFLTKRSHNAEYLGDLMILIGGCIELIINNLKAYENWFQGYIKEQWTPRFLMLFRCNSTISQFDFNSLNNSPSQQFLQYIVEPHRPQEITTSVTTQNNNNALQGTLITASVLNLASSKIQNISVEGNIFIFAQNSTQVFRNVSFNGIKSKEFFSSNFDLEIKLISCRFQTIMISERWLGKGQITIEESQFDNSQLKSNQPINCKLISYYYHNSIISIDKSIFRNINGNSTCNSPLIELYDGGVLIISNSTYQFNSGHILFKIENINEFIISENSKISSNKGSDSCIGLIKGTTKTIINETMIQENHCANGVFFAIKDKVSLQVQFTNFTENQMDKFGGIFHFSDQSVAIFQSSIFSQNRCIEDGRLIASTSKSKKSHSLIMKECQFSKNEGESILSVYWSSMSLRDSLFLDNYNGIGSSYLIQLFGSNTIINNSLFYNSQLNSSRNCENSFNKTGFIWNLAQNALNVFNSSFQGGCNNNGGAIQSNFDSHILISHSRFFSNYALNGGALYLQQNSSLIVNYTQFSFNYAFHQGSDISIINSNSPQSIENSNFGQHQSSSIYIDRASLSLLFCSFMNSSLESELILCKQCYGLNIKSSLFMEMELGSAISIHSRSFLPRISRNTFEIYNCTFSDLQGKFDGSAVQINSHQGVTEIRNNIFANIRNSLNKGGAIALIHSKPESEVIVSENIFEYVNALIGGAIYWDYKKPELLTENSFTECYGSLYGQNFGSYGVKLSFISASDYESNLRENIEIATVSKQIIIGLQRSGHPLQQFYIAILDPFNQIVRTVQSPSYLTLALEQIGQNSQQSELISLLNYQNTRKFEKGALRVQDLIIVGDPNQNYQLSIESSYINPLLPDVKEYLDQSNSIDLSIDISMRKCDKGEAFLPSGQCQKCPPGFYLLVAPISPQGCLKCPTKAICHGGDIIGPRAGYWRQSQISTYFIPCQNKKICIGRLDQNDPPLGKCAKGHKGFMCMECQERYSRNSQFQCSKCPQNGANIALLCLSLIIILIVIILLIRITLISIDQKKSLFASYFRLITTHLQILMLISTFKMQWPQQVSAFLLSSDTVVNLSTQFFSIDCLFGNSISLKRFYIYIIGFSILPVIGITTALIFWRIRIRKNKARRNRYLLSTVLIFLFLVHPALTQIFMKTFQCRSIDGVSRLVSELGQECFSGLHLQLAIPLGIIGLLFWSLGVPLVSCCVLYDERNNLEGKRTKQKYGFLFKGYKKKYYYWETLTMLRKVSIIFISVFLVGAGHSIQALTLLLFLILYLYFTIRIRPFISNTLNGLEVTSMVALIITVYCGIIFLASRNPLSQEFEEGRDYELTSPIKWLLLLAIVLSNCLFVIQWIWKLISELRGTLKSKCKSCFIMCCLCGK